MEFAQRNAEYIRKMSKDENLHQLSLEWVKRSGDYEYGYHFAWLGRPIIQLPQDIMDMQEIIWQVKPDVIIETGIAHGGSLIFYASMLALLELTGQIECGRVLGIDIDIRAHNRQAIEAHPLSSKITMFEGSSIDPAIIEQVTIFAKSAQTVLVCLDSLHTHAHVLAELQAYAPLVSAGSYCVVFDTVIEDMPAGFFPDRPWDKGNNPKTAVREFLKTHDEFVIDQSIESKLLITVAPDGYLKRVK
jgi:cephalosporin hydroxylase